MTERFKDDLPAQDLVRARRDFFEGMYRENDEPWEYSRSAAEVLRHQAVVSVARSLRRGPFRRILDVGCSLGQLTARLDGLGPEIHAIDLSPIAARQARRHCLGDGPTATPRSDFRFHVGSVTDLPFRAQSFDLLLLCDGLHSWQLTPDEQRAVLERVYELLMPGGHAILTDALKPFQIEGFVRRVESGPFEVSPVRFLNDRLWYSLERATRPVQHWSLIKSALASRGVARGLSLLSRLAGKRGTKHVMMIGRKPGASDEAA